jgi:hypothetical protein
MIPLTTRLFSHWSIPLMKKSGKGSESHPPTPFDTPQKSSKHKICGLHISWTSRKRRWIAHMQAVLVRIGGLEAQAHFCIKRFSILNSDKKLKSKLKMLKHMAVDNQSKTYPMMPLSD